MFAVILLYAAFWIFSLLWVIGAFLYAKALGIGVQKFGFGGIADRLTIKKTEVAGYGFEIGWGFLPFVTLVSPPDNMSLKQVLIRGFAPIVQLLFVIMVYMIFVLSPKDFVETTSLLFADDFPSADSSNSEPVPDSVQAVVDDVISEYGFIRGNLAVTAGFLFVVILIAVPVAVTFSAIVFIDASGEKLDKKLGKKG